MHWNLVQFLVVDSCVDSCVDACALRIRINVASPIGNNVGTASSFNVMYVLSTSSGIEW